MKRSNGEGSVWWDAKRGVWLAAMSFEAADGSKKRKTFSGKTREDASDRLKVALGKQVLGEQPTTDTRNLGDYLAQWLHDEIQPKRSLRTYQIYAQNVRLYIKPYIGTVRLSSVKAEHIQRVQARMTSAGLGANTILSMRTTLSVALNRAVRWGLIARNPVSLVDPPALPDDEPEVLTRPQAEALINAAAGEAEYQRLYILLLSTGLRISECVGLRWCDIDLDTATLRVSKQLDRSPRPQLVSLKTRRSRRVIPLIPPAIDALRAQRALCRQRRLEGHGGWSGEPTTDFVFSDVLGMPLRAYAVWQHLKRHAKAAGLPKSVHVHTLRHSAATFLLAGHVERRVVMDIMGHSSMEMTSHYQHVLDSMLTDAAIRLAAVFPATGTDA